MLFFAGFAYRFAHRLGLAEVVEFYMNYKFTVQGSSVPT